MSWESVSSGICNQVISKPACSATETSQSLETLEIASIGIKLSEQQTSKVLIRLHKCAGWSAPLLFTYGIRCIYSGLGSAEKTTSKQTSFLFLSLSEVFTLLDRTKQTQQQDTKSETTDTFWMYNVRTVNILTFFISRFCAPELVHVD